MLKKHLGRKFGLLSAIALVVLMLLSPISPAMQQAAAAPTVSDAAALPAYVPVGFLGSLSNSTLNYTGSMQVLLIFNFSHQDSLQLLLDNISNPFSPGYHRYLSESQFNSQFAPSSTMYSEASSYFSQFGLTDQMTFQNRLVLSITGSAQEFSQAFHTGLREYTLNGATEYSPSSSPELPAWLAGSVSHIIGLSSFNPQFNLNIAGLKQFQADSASASPSPSQPQYPAMNTHNGIQYLYGSYFQKAYNETPLFSKTYGEGQVIATILWTGSYKNSAGNEILTGPYDPSNIYDYFNKSLPSNEPHPKIYGVPVNNAPLPGTSAQNDTSGAVVENTLDLEMAGSMAPGATIFNVYGSNGTFQDLTLSFETALSPGSAYPALNNVSVISNSWGANDGFNSTWNQLLQECQARGITVLASTGDSGNNFSSSKSVSSTEYVQFPSTVGFNTYGVVAVGGTNVSLYSDSQASNYLTLQSEQAWYVPASINGGDTLGSVGGVSAVYPEPTWQVLSQANSVIRSVGSGRGVPDVSAVANNTLIEYSNTTTGGLFIVAGTSISSPIVGGMIAVMNAYRLLEGHSRVGFIDPSIYMLGTQQYDPALAGGISPALPPFYDVVQGHNEVYSALTGYDLVTGMGSVNAYNFMEDLSGKRYNVSFRETGLVPLVNWTVSVEGTLYNSSGEYVNLSLSNGTYYYSVPVIGYNVSDPVAGNFTVKGKQVNISLQFRRGYLVTFNQNSLPLGNEWILNAWNYTESAFNQSISLYFPNGTYNYSVTSVDPNYYGSSGNFTVNGSALFKEVLFTRGIFNITFVESGLPANQQWSVRNETELKNSTNQSITFTVLGGGYTFGIPPSGKYIGNHTTVTLNTNGKNRTVHIGFGYGYFITFSATGVPTGVQWTLVIADYNISSANSSQTVEVQNGTYNYHAYFQSGSSVTSIRSNLTVNGTNLAVSLAFSQPRTPLEYYVLYIALAAMGVVILGIGLYMLRKK